MSIFLSNAIGEMNLIIVDDNYQNGVIVKLQDELEAMQEILKTTLQTLEKVSESNNQILEASVTEKLAIFTQEAKGLLDEQLNNIAVELEIQARGYINEIDTVDIGNYK